MLPRCRDYRCQAAEEKSGVDFVINADFFRMDAWPGLTEDQIIYMESGTIFRSHLLEFNGLVLHASAVEIDGKAYLFSAPCGTGKSTHTRLWQTVFGEKARVFNDDKPALRFLDGRWYAYGTPWCGKDGINLNMRVPLAGICFLKQAPHNKIRRLSRQEAVQKLIWQTVNKFTKEERMDLMLSCVASLVENIPVFELENRPEPEAARLSYQTMRREAREI